MVVKADVVTLQTWVAEALLNTLCHAYTKPSLSSKALFLPPWPTWSEAALAGGQDWAGVKLPLNSRQWGHHHANVFTHGLHRRTSRRQLP
jgi:hypothetical protein